MGKLILCTGTITKKPFCFKMSETNVYSIEELCYYIYNNIYAMTEDIFDETLVEWLKNQAELEEIANKLHGMIVNHNSLKDIVISILCSADYYSEEEMQELIGIIDEIEHLKPISKRKIKGDNFLKYKNYGEAQREYEKILTLKEVRDFTPEEYGNLLHNIGVARIHTTSYTEAAIIFKDAYSRNHDAESLKQYLFALKLGNFQEKFIEELAHYQVTGETAARYIEQLDHRRKEAQDLAVFKTIKRIPELKLEEHNKKIDDLLWKWKQTYKGELK
jgi:succinylglutamate desuccinylase